MNNTGETYRIIISGGGTGGHIYPAIAIAKAWNEKYPESEVLFVGAEGKMEMQKVPEAGYKIEGLKIAGLQRRLTLANLSFPFKVLSSLQKAKK
ncbi:UDP-N-acetylglucosamine--N-acetylmuramyl- (pentapeptide) pyrophosphoryl-undecaprenol N-acetylglucosamine transferase [Cyclobacterium qasimii M12-11B]|nr:UDP-N-acetylglucosamine--N-acetylmuramyl- (pentapeptide) pyrophosphoryl-undecaprenol N-acetylglucosamine transferase [Cyclobacterium qasimii M12-11B]